MMIELALCCVHSFLGNLETDYNPDVNDGQISFVLNTIAILLAVHGESYFRSLHFFI